MGSRHEAAAPVRVVFFDAVGTIVRPYPSVGSVYARAAAACGVRCGGRLLEEQFRIAYHDLLPRRFFGACGCRTSEGRERNWWKDVVSLTFRRAGCGTVPPTVRERAFDSFSGGGAWRAYADAAPVMERLVAMGVRVGVISNFDSRLHSVMAGTGLRRYCSVVVVSSETGWAKPSPEIFLGAVARMGVSPGEALHVGDREREDRRGALRAGLRALLLRRGGGSGSGGHVIGTLRAIPALLTRPAGLRPGSPTAGVT